MFFDELDRLRMSSEDAAFRIIIVYKRIDENSMTARLRQTAKGYVEQPLALR